MKDKYWIIVFFAALFLFTACKDKEEVYSLIPSDLISASLILSVDEVLTGYNREVDVKTEKCVFVDDSVLTRSYAESPQNTISTKGVIYEFTSSGELYYRSELFSLDLTYGVPSAITTSLRAGTNLNVYLFVAEEESDLPTINHESEFDQLKHANKELIDSDKYPFYAFQKGVSIYSNSNNNLKPFRLQRLCVKLILDYSIAQSSGFTLSEIRIVNIPVDAYYSAESQPANNEYTTVAKSASGTNGRLVLYIPENNQGVIPSIEDPQDKNITKAPVSATCVELHGRYKSDKVIFRIYPGANATNDFNLSRNHWYRIYFNISDVYVDDLRVESYNDEEFVIHLTDEPSRDYSSVFKVLLNNKLWIDDFELKENRLVLDYTSNPGSHLNNIKFFDRSGTELFGGAVDFTFAVYSTMSFSSMLHAQGIGSPDDPYLIIEPKQLKNISRICQAGYKSRRYKQLTHIELSEFDKNRWTPIGTDYYPFQGIYEGNGFSVRNLTINTEATGNNNQRIERAGLFGYVRSSVIRNLHIRNGYIGCRSASQGSIAAIADHSLIEACSSTLTLEQFSPANSGGIVGELFDSNIKDCYNACQRDLTTWNSTTYYTGGIVGYAMGSNISNVYSLQPIWIKDSYSLGAVAGALLQPFSIDNIFAVEYTTTGNKIIGNPASTSGLMRKEDMQTAAFVSRLNSATNPGTWLYLPGQFPKLKGER